ncbi:YqjF family protein [Paenibacillus sp. GCM10027626]|uniref:YqjF family protein n=1 Tax=Paenibacillus sp. GCM10027626 TaxID=3273411 RepID=UPI003636CFE5
MSQTLNDLLFAHWPISLKEIQALVPSSLQIDTFEKQAWISVVPFWTNRARLRWGPSLPFLSQFPEINLRTYVTLNGKPGVYFFSLDADQRIIVEIARWGLHLPYFRANIQYAVKDNNLVHYHSIRTDHRTNPGQFAAVYRSVSDIFQSKKGSLEHWLTERYCLYTIDEKGRIYRGEIDHSPWPLQRAEADISMLSLPASFGLQLPAIQPLLHFSKKHNVHAWLLESCD